MIWAKNPEPGQVICAAFCDTDSEFRHVYELETVLFDGQKAKVVHSDCNPAHRFVRFCFDEPYRGQPVTVYTS